MNKPLQNSLGVVPPDEPVPQRVQQPVLYSEIRSRAARRGWQNCPARESYQERLDRVRELLALGLTNLEVAARMGLKPNSIPAYKRALGIEVKGFRKGTGRGARKAKSWIDSV